jgi:hypothetical protein
MFVKSRRGVMNWMIGLAYGTMMFVILVVLASAIGTQFGNVTGGQANITAVYIVSQLGQAGLAGYLPLIFIAAIAIGIISMLGFKVAGGAGKY